MLIHFVAVALAADPPSAEVAAVIATSAPDLPSCFEGLEGHLDADAALAVTVGADGKVTKVAVDHTTGNFPEDCGLSVLRDLPWPAAAATLPIVVRKGVDRSVVAYGPAVGKLRLEEATASAVRACAFANPGLAPDPATGAVVQYVYGSAGKVVSADVVFGGFTGAALQDCVLAAYGAAKLPKVSRGGAIVVWEPLRWTVDDAR